MTPKPGTLVRCPLQECHHYDEGIFALPGDFACDRAGHCPVLHPPPPPALWRRRWFQLCAAAALFLVLTSTFLVRRAAVLAAKKPRIVALSGSDAVLDEPWQAYVETRGEEPFSYQWYRGYHGDISDPVAGAAAPRYQTKLAGSRQVFWVRVTNRYGSADSGQLIVDTTPRIDYTRELAELYRDARKLLEQTDSISVLDKQLHTTVTPLAFQERNTFSNLRKISQQKQAEAAAGFVKKLAYLRTLDRQAVTRTMREIQGVAVPGLEGERRQKTFSTMLTHWNEILGGKNLSELEVIEDAQRYLPL